MDKADRTAAGRGGCCRAVDRGDTGRSDEADLSDDLCGGHDAAESGRKAPHGSKQDFKKNKQVFEKRIKSIKSHSIIENRGTRRRASGVDSPQKSSYRKTPVERWVFFCCKLDKFGL